MGLFQELLPEKVSEGREPAIIKVSMKSGEGTEEFRNKVKEMFLHGGLSRGGELVITNTRHKEALQEAYDSLQMVRESVDKGLPEDFYSIDLMNAYASLGRIIGEEVDDDLVEEIFSKFCMGK